MQSFIEPRVLTASFCACASFGSSKEYWSDVVRWHTKDAAIDDLVVVTGECLFGLARKEFNMVHQSSCVRNHVRFFNEDSSDPLQRNRWIIQSWCRSGSDSPQGLEYRKRESSSIDMVTERELTFVFLRTEVTLYMKSWYPWKRISWRWYRR